MKKAKKKKLITLTEDLESDLKKLAQIDHCSLSHIITIALYTYVKRVKTKKPYIFESKSTQSDSDSDIQYLLDHHQPKDWSDSDEEEWEYNLEHLKQPTLTKEEFHSIFMARKSESQSDSQSESDSLDVVSTTKKKKIRKTANQQFSSPNRMTKEEFFSDTKNQEFAKSIESANLIKKDKSKKVSKN